MLALGEVPLLVPAGFRLPSGGTRAGGHDGERAGLEGEHLSLR